MKTNFLGLTLAAAFAFGGIFPTALGGPRGHEGVDGAMWQEASDPAPALDLSPYAPANPVMDWSEKRSGEMAWLAAPETFSHPSLAGDLMELPREIASLDLQLDLLAAGTPEIPAPAQSAETGDQPEPEIEPVKGEADGEVGGVRDISGVPHPLFASLAALLGLILLVSRRENFA